jgi:signal transduction histidine kinase
VQGLLSPARLENAAPTVEPVDLDTVLADRVAMWESLAAEQYVTRDITGPPAGRVWAIPGALGQIMDNLLANALRVSPPSTTITLHRGPGSELHIIDQGPGMNAADHERAYDRFWRSGGAITLHPTPGTGLDTHIQLRPATPHFREQRPGGEDFSSRHSPGHRAQPGPAAG